MSSRTVRVLESVAAPGPSIKYIDQVVRLAPDTVEFNYFNWARALLGRYDVLHVHWPEFLIRSRRMPVRVLKRTLFRLLLLRIRSLSIPVVRTQHNPAPHDQGDAEEERLLARLDTLVTTRVFLDAATVDARDGEITRVISHGHYRDQFGNFQRNKPEAGRLLFFGRIEPYKRVPSLIDAFEGAARAGDELRIVGRPSLAAVREDIEKRADSWARNDAGVVLRLEHVPDEDMVAEVTSAEAVVLPYREMNNSGVVLVALSLERPVIVPASPTNASIADEVGPGWVIQYEGEFDAAKLADCLAQVRGTSRSEVNLSARDWNAVAGAYADAFHDAAGRRRRPRVYVNAGGQRDNIGDSLLRRAYLDALRPLGVLHVYVGPDADYTSGLGLRAEDVWYGSPRKWLVHALLGALAGSTIAFNTGEVVGTPEEGKKGAWQLVVARIAKLRGSRTILAGVSLRPGTSVEHTHLRPIADSAAYLSWRDEWSRDQLGRGQVQPDWAYSLGTDPSGWAAGSDRDVLAIAMRGDRPMPPDAWFDAVETTASTLNLRTVVVVQVRRDRERAYELASRLNAEVLEWNEENHEAQEAKVRALYSRSAAIVSDRIHALIVGFTEGAVPLGFSTGSVDKVVRSLKPGTSAYRLVVSADDADSGRWVDAINRRELLSSDLLQARREIAGVASALVKLERR